ncbi:amidohydrolase [Mesosutterella sp. OilRF-GAM-744-9]|uniref:Amidohydrolase n=1 Tax=Mesosutterella porci TaxID=2915351 RepID=A0ABS9MMX7_9BURK|nr:amidohydrolase [Mesosutterella sp. oilRF-744-WT-GAM-9]MCG5029975.1 amidohydrolase [Mesosutterella sp. oilRF-744-WT-GAM-9]MCI6530146.1 amidohydrolase [Mesosutterella sp.]
MEIVLKERVYPEIAAWADELAAIRREIHETPELGFDTPFTVARIVKCLQSWGITGVDTETVPGGVAAVVDGSRPGPTIALRADIDALPMEDCSGKPWKSRIEGHAHTCGHDGHQTWLLGALRYLRLKRGFPGRVVGLFQPAEEPGKGAIAVIQSGFFQKYNVREIFGAHDDPFLDKGVFGFRAGPLQAASDTFQVTLRGVGTHGGRPHQGVDPIPVGCAIVSELQTIVSRRVNPIETAVVSVCSFNAGRLETLNVIPHMLTFSGIVRTFDPEIRRLVEEKFKKIVNGVAEANDCTAEITYTHLICAVNNSRPLTEAAIRVVTGLFGSQHVRPSIDPMMGSEDFAEYQRVVPGCIMRFGIRDKDHTVPLHNQTFDFNDEVLPAASTVFAALAKDRLETLARGEEPCGQL